MFPVQRAKYRDGVMTQMLGKAEGNITEGPPSLMRPMYYPKLKGPVGVIQGERIEKGF